MNDDQDTVRWALRGHWLVDKLSERTIPNGRTVLELVDADIWTMPGGTEQDYVDAVDSAMRRDTKWGEL